jgi:hypothetical protein
MMVALKDGHLVVLTAVSKVVLKAIQKVDERVVKMVA